MTRDLRPGTAISAQARGLHAGVGFHAAPLPRLQLAGLLDTWAPTGTGSRDLRHLRLVPTVQASYLIIPRLSVSTQQSAVLALGARDAALWSSSYLAHGELIGPLSAGAGLDLALGRLASGRFNGLAASMAAHVTAGALRVSLGARLAITQDHARRFGRLGLTTTVSADF